MQDISLSDAVAHPLACYRNQLEFNGYHVEEGEESIVARHPRKPPLTIKLISNRGGVLVSLYYISKPGVERIQLLEYANDLSAQFFCLKAYIDKDNDLAMEAFLEGDYNKTNFSVLLDNIEYDREIFGNHEMTQTCLK